MAKEFGKEDAVFMPSGVMAQNIALLIHSKKEHMNSEELSKGLDRRFACHHSSHLLLWEEESYSKLVGMSAVEVETKNKSVHGGVCVPPMGLEDVATVFARQKEQYSKDMTLGETGLTSLIIELPHRELGGKLTPWNEVISIGELCRTEGVRYHCDGARMFEASAGYG